MSGIFDEWNGTARVNLNGVTDPGSARLNRLGSNDGQRDPARLELRMNDLERRLYLMEDLLRRLQPLIEKIRDNTEELAVEIKAMDRHAS